MELEKKVKLPTTVWGLAFGRGFAKARTGGELLNSCEVSHETTPRLTPNPLLGDGKDSTAEIRKI